MPVVNFHLTQGCFTESQARELLLASAELYAQVLDAPMERIRAFITPHSANHCLVLGDTVDNNGMHAPYFEFIVFEGRSLEQRHYLLRCFTDLLSRILGVDKSLVRGSCRRVSPEDWGIGGVPASTLRQKEIQERAQSEQNQ